VQRADARSAPAASGASGAQKIMIVELRVHFKSLNEYEIFMCHDFVQQFVINDFVNVDIHVFQLNINMGHVKHFVN
jgi:hypothetical protein